MSAVFLVLVGAGLQEAPSSRSATVKVMCTAMGIRAVM